MACDLPPPCVAMASWITKKAKNSRVSEKSSMEDRLIYDSPPPQTSDFIQPKQRTFRGCLAQGRIRSKSEYPCIFSLCAGKGLSSDDVGEGVERDTVFPEIRPGAGSETGDFVKEKSWGGYTAERLRNGDASQASPIFAYKLPVSKPFSVFFPFVAVAQG